jgi:C-terminal processing protease CtpA/Prc
MVLYFVTKDLYLVTFLILLSPTALLSGKEIDCESKILNEQFYMKAALQTKKPTGAFIVLFTAIFLNSIASGQTTIPLIKASSKSVSVRDGAVLRKGVWNLSPETKPDVYTVLEPSKESTITFYTDIDSISFRVKPDTTYDFVIVLNGSDSCYTRISTLVPKPFLYSKGFVLTPDALMQDFIIFRQALEKEHAGLYRFKDKSTITRLLDSSYGALNRSMTPISFYLMLTRIISALEDGHTGCSLPDEYTRDYAQKEPIFPFKLWFIGKKAYIECSNNDVIPAESEITAINGMPVSEVQAALFRHLPSDGKIQTKKIWNMNGGAFFFLYNFIYGEKQVHTIEYKTKAGKTGRAIANAEFIEELASKCVRPRERISPYLKLEFKENNIAVLTVKTFDDNRLSAAKENFNDFLDASFSEIRKKSVDQLIIDLRGNGGGADQYGALLYSYLTDKPFRYFASIQTVTRKLNETDNSGLAIQKPQEESYKGKVVFLINGLCFSTASDFCAIAKSNRRGIFVGEETGGGYYGNTSGGSFRATLPNSHIRIAIPTARYENAVRKTPHMNRGVIPDHIVLPSISDIRQDKDVQFEYALNSIRKKATSNSAEKAP